jgi:hypothetical protein
VNLRPDHARPRRQHIPEGLAGRSTGRNTAVLPRGLYICVNLTARIAEAQREGWLGEAEGLKVSLAAAEAKLTQVDGLIARRRDAVSLGMPSFPDITGRTSAPAKEPR